MLVIYANAGPGHTPLGFWTGTNFSGNMSHAMRFGSLAETTLRHHEELATASARMIGGLVCGGNLAGVFILGLPERGVF